MIVSSQLASVFLVLLECCFFTYVFLVILFCLSLSHTFFAAVDVRRIKLHTITRPTTTSIIVRGLSYIIVQIVPQSPFLDQS